MQIRRGIRHAFAIALLFPLPVGAGDAEDARSTPVSRNERLFLATCTPCHGVSPIAAKRDGPGGWRQTVDKMIGLGAQVHTAAERDALVEHLTTTYGPAAGAMKIGKLPVGAVLDSVEPASLPAGPGSDLVRAYCMMCHDLGVVVATRRRAAEWQRITSAMFAKAAIMPAEQDLRELDDYLTANFGNGAPPPR